MLQKSGQAPAWWGRLARLQTEILSLFFSFFIGVVLRVEVRVTFPARALSRNTPVMQAVLFEDPNDARFLKVWPVSQVRNIFKLFYELK